MNPFFLVGIYKQCNKLLEAEILLLHPIGVSGHKKSHYK
jgi:hypothetical protein